MRAQAVLKVISTTLMIARNAIMLYKTYKGECPSATNVQELLEAKDTEKEFTELIKTWDSIEGKD